MKNELPITDESNTCPEIVETLEENQLNDTGPKKSEPKFYEDAKEYWSKVPSTVNGMLGGLGYISTIDIKGSSAFLKSLSGIGNKSALDCGAGIGRVSKNLLLPLFAKVDMVEQDTIFASKIVEYCTSGEGTVMGFPKRLGQVYNVGLQQFRPENGKYDLIWIQWVLGHLTDQDLLTFLQRCYDGLTTGGYIVIKENVTSKEVDKDDTDSSVTRPRKAYENCLKQAGFQIVKIKQQQSFPKGLYPVYMIAATCQLKVSAKNLIKQQ